MSAQNEWTEQGRPPRDNPGLAMRRAVLPALIVLISCLNSANLHAHSGNQNVFYEGNVGPYQARIMIEQPEVVPGLSQINIRMLRGEPEQITVLPLKWNLGKQGAPTPDIATPVRGEPTLYAAELWFMEGGSQSVAVNMSGPDGEGEVLIPVAVKATRVESMPAGLGVLLGFLMLLLVLLLLGIVRGAVRESPLPPGTLPSRKRIWMSRLAVLLAAALLGGGLYGGKLWWDAEADAYRNQRLYRPIDSEAVVQTAGASRTLRLKLGQGDFQQSAPIVPDHGKLMHLVLVKEDNLDAMAHLHPLKLNRRTFVAPIPDDLPAGAYSLYAEVTYETGFSENVTNRVEIAAVDSELARSANGIAVDSDPDDSWIVAAPGDVSTLNNRRRIADIGDGFVVEWLDATVIEAGVDLSLRFQVRFAPANDQPVRPDYYMGMLGHLFLRSHDGHLFTHLHPAGSYSMASQQLFDLRAQGKAPNEVNYGSGEALCQIPDVDQSLAYWNAQKSAEADHSISFPWKFMEPGDYRIWLQVKIAGNIRTAAFDVKVWPRS